MLESLRVPPTPHQYAGLAGRDAAPRSQRPAADVDSPTDGGFDQHGYLHVIADPHDGDQTEVCYKHEEFPWSVTALLL